MCVNLFDYLQRPEAKPSEFARAIGVSPSVVYQWRTKLRPVPIGHCAAIERATEGAVTRRDLRPDDWHLIWPELATEGAAQ